MAKKRINVMFSEELLRDLRELVPARKRSEFIEEVVEEKVRLLKQKQEIGKYAGILKAEDYPHWATLEDIHRWLDELRSGKGRREYIAKVHEESTKMAEEREKKNAGVSSR